MTFNLVQIALLILGAPMFILAGMGLLAGVVLAWLMVIGLARYACAEIADCWRQHRTRP